MVQWAPGVRSVDVWEKPRQQRHWDSPSFCGFDGQLKCCTLFVHGFVQCCFWYAWKVWLKGEILCVLIYYHNYYNYYKLHVIINCSRIVFSYDHFTLSIHIFRKNYFRLIMLDWIDPSMKCHVWKMEKKSFLLFCCPVSQILIASAFVNSKRGACDRFQMIFMSVPREFKRAVPAQQNQPDLIGWDWKKVQIAPTLIDGCNNGWFPTLYSASWLSIDFRLF